jgi:hypothetical protein
LRRGGGWVAPSGRGGQAVRKKMRRSGGTSSRGSGSRRGGRGADARWALERKANGRADPRGSGKK